MRYQVPQFIETEDRLVGPLTFKQFMYVGAPAGVVTIMFFLMPIILWSFVAIILVGVGVALAFAKINGRPILLFIIAFLNGARKPKIYVLRTAVPVYVKELEQVQVKTKRKDRVVVQKKAVKKQPRRFKAPSFDGVSALRNRLATTTHAIPKREKPLPQNFGIPKIEFNERLEVVRHLSGAREVARRIDYR